jgi:hypothetical protein
VAEAGDLYLESSHGVHVQGEDVLLVVCRGDKLVDEKVAGTEVL